MMNNYSMLILLLKISVNAWHPPHMLFPNIPIVGGQLLKWSGIPVGYQSISYGDLTLNMIGPPNF
jgi:hypothetical protein